MIITLELAIILAQILVVAAWKYCGVVAFAVPNMMIDFGRAPDDEAEAICRSPSK